MTIFRKLFRPLSRIRQRIYRLCRWSEVDFDDYADKLSQQAQALAIYRDALKQHSIGIANADARAGEAISLAQEALASVRAVTEKTNLAIASIASLRRQVSSLPALHQRGHFTNGE